VPIGVELPAVVVPGGIAALYKRKEDGILLLAFGADWVALDKRIALDSLKLISFFVTVALIAQSPRDAMFYGALRFGANVKGGVRSRSLGATRARPSAPPAPVIRKAESNAALLQSASSSRVTRAHRPAREPAHAPTISLITSNH
jgi:hypothetical protein